MNNFNIRLSHQIDPMLMSEVLNEDQIVVGPTVLSNIITKIKDVNSIFDPSDFDKTYSNDTGKILSSCKQLVSAIFVPICSHANLSCHYIPIQTRSLLSVNSSLNIEETKYYHDTLVSCENIALLLTLMGRDVFFPIAKEISEIEIYINDGIIYKSDLNFDMLPGYVCHIYKPEIRIRRIECIYIDRVEKFAESKINNPTISIDDFEKPNKETIKNSSYEKYYNKSERLKQLMSSGIISNDSFIEAVHSDYEIDKLITKADLDNRRQIAACDPDDIKKSLGSIGKKCPECNKIVNGRCNECNVIFGRRGWREIGVYDG